MLKEKKNLSIGSRLVQVIKDNGINQSKLADSVGLSTGYLSEIIKDKKVPSKTVLMAIQGAYGVSAHWLLTGEDSAQTGNKSIDNTSTDTVRLSVSEEALQGDEMSIMDYKDLVQYQRKEIASFKEEIELLREKKRAVSGE